MKDRILRVIPTLLNKLAQWRDHETKNCIPVWMAMLSLRLQRAFHEAHSRWRAYQKRCDVRSRTNDGRNIVPTEFLLTLKHECASQFCAWDIPQQRQMAPITRPFLVVPKALGVKLCSTTVWCSTLNYSAVQMLTARTTVSPCILFSLIIKCPHHGPQSEILYIRR